MGPWQDKTGEVAREPLLPQWPKGAHVRRLGVVEHSVFRTVPQMGAGILEGEGHAQLAWNWSLQLCVQEGKSACWI